MAGFDLAASQQKEPDGGGCRIAVRGSRIGRAMARPNRDAARAPNHDPLCKHRAGGGALAVIDEPVSERVFGGGASALVSHQTGIKDLAADLRVALGRTLGPQAAPLWIRRPV